MLLVLKNGDTYKLFTNIVFDNNQYKITILVDRKIVTIPVKDIKRIEP